MNRCVCMCVYAVCAQVYMYRYVHKGVYISTMCKGSSIVNSLSVIPLANPLGPLRCVSVNSRSEDGAFMCVCVTAGCA